MSALTWRETGVEWQPDHTWMTEAQLAKCERAFNLPDDAGLPIPTRNVSNGEYLPKPQAQHQKRVDRRLRELIESSAKKLGISRAKFAASNRGIAAGLVAMNEVHGNFFNVRPSAMLDADEFEATGVPRDVFVVDDQLHFVRGKFTHLQPFRAASQGPTSGYAVNPFNEDRFLDEQGRDWNPWDPSLVGLPLGNDTFHLVQFIKDVYLDSQVTVGLISNVTGYIALQAGDQPDPHPNVELARGGELLTAAQTAAARNFINEIAGSRRTLCHGLLYTGIGNLDYIRYQIENHRPDSWKGYTATDAAKIDLDPHSLMRPWRQDDEVVAYPTYQVIADAYAKLKTELPGLNNICVHKGLVPRDTPDLPEQGHPSDLPRACRDWPQLNFVTYHACIKDGVFDYDALQAVRAAEAGEPGAVRDGVPDIAWTTLYAQLTAPYLNSYAEVGTTFGGSVVNFPSVTAHILGQLLKYKGEDQIVFGTDSIWHGSPQWQLEAFWRFQIPDEIRERWDYPELTETAKRKIIGLTSARLYGLSLNARRYKPVPKDYVARMTPEFRELLEIDQPADKLAKMRSSYQAMGEVDRRTMRFGWVRVTA
jgi:predicted TIM-barrel fold metal-dependent hydrolase